MEHFFREYARKGFAKGRDFIPAAHDVADDNPNQVGVSVRRQGQHHHFGFQAFLIDFLPFLKRLDCGANFPVSHIPIFDRVNAASTSDGI